MSLPDHLLEDEEELCEGCGMPFNDDGRLCQDCKADCLDLYSDATIQDAKEGKH